MGDFWVREKFRWVVQVQRADGQIVEHEVINLWSPHKDYVIESIKGAAAAEYAVFHAPRGPKGEIMPCAGVSAVYVPAQPEPDLGLPAAA